MIGRSTNSRRNPFNSKAQLIRHAILPFALSLSKGERRISQMRC